jgi:hypothetical protein
MAKNQKPRKQYRPRRVDGDPIDMAISLIALLTPEQKRFLNDPIRKALAAFTSGQGDSRAWEALADCMNVGEALAEGGIASNQGQLFLAGQRALCAVLERHRETGQWALESHEASTLDEAVWMSGVQYEYASQGEVQRAIDLVRRRVSAARHGNAGPRVMAVGSIGEVRQDLVQGQPVLSEQNAL